MFGYCHEIIDAQIIFTLTKFEILVRKQEGDKKFAYSKLADGPDCDVYEKQNFKLSDNWFVRYSKEIRFIFNFLIMLF